MKSADCWQCALSFLLSASEAYSKWRSINWIIIFINIVYIIYFVIYHRVPTSLSCTIQIDCSPLQARGRWHPPHRPPEYTRSSKSTGLKYCNIELHFLVLCLLSKVFSKRVINKHVCVQGSLLIFKNKVSTRLRIKSCVPIHRYQSLSQVSVAGSFLKMSSSRQR